MPQYQPKAIIKDGIPGNAEGYEGEVRYGKVGGKMFQFVRLNNKWNSIPFTPTLAASLSDTIRSVKVESTTISSQTISSIICDTIKINNTVLDDANNAINTTNLINHPGLTSQAHSDYLLNTESDTMEGSLKITGTAPVLGASETYILSAGI